MQPVTTVGIDTSKHVFHIHGVDGRGHMVLTKRVARHKVLAFVTQLPPCLIGMEASDGTHYWARAFLIRGHTVKLMPPQQMKPYIQHQKNDSNDAAGLCEATSRPRIRGVPVKSVAQQDMPARSIPQPIPLFAIAWPVTS